MEYTVNYGNGPVRKSGSLFGYIMFRIIIYVIKIIQRLPFMRLYTTGQHKKYWLKINDEQYWREYQQTYKHPHRMAIMALLKERVNWL